MKALITGSSGFIGSKLADSLKMKGHEVIGISRNSNGISSESIFCDFSKGKINKKAFKGVDAIFHLAGIAHDTSNQKYSINDYRSINTRTTKEIFESAIEHKVEKFFFISSVKAEQYELSKPTLIEPKHYYGISKREAEEYILGRGDSGIQTIIVRPSLVYGNAVKGNLGLMYGAIKNRLFPPLPNINNQRSLVHVDDLVSAIIFLNDKCTSTNEIFTVTDGRVYSTSDIYEAILMALERKIPKFYIPLWFIRRLDLLGPRGISISEKILGDELYDSSKLYNLGFRAKKTLFQKGSF